MNRRLTKTNLSILILEDDEDYAKYTKMILSRVSDRYNFHLASTIKDAIFILSKESIDIVLTDLGLPDGQGLSVIGKIKQVNPKVPILLLTNLDDHELGIQAINEGASDYISKKNVVPELVHRMIIHAIERMKILTQLEEHKLQILKMQKMEALVTLVGGISHDFNNIITLIQGYAELIDNHPSTPKDLNKYNNQIIKASKRAANLIEQLSTFSREESRKAEVVDINLQIKSLLELLYQITREEISIELDLCEGNALVSINPTNFEQIIINLVLNAREAIEGAGTITIKTKKMPSCPTCGIAEPVINITIEDDGSGIKAEHLNNIFDPYFTTKPQGSGLGLATVYGLVNQVNGCINVFTEEGIGTSMKICFIASSSIEIDQFEKNERLENHESPKITNLLIVDDDQDILNLLYSMLQSEGYKIKTLNDPIRALEEVLSGSIQPSLILSDVIMPKMSGIQFSQKIHAKFPNIPIVLMSGYSPQYYEDLDSHHLEIIRKPFSKMELMKILSEAING